MQTQYCILFSVSNSFYNKKKKGFIERKGLERKGKEEKRKEKGRKNYIKRRILGTIY